MIAHEFARSAEDVVWRRTKSGLRMTADEIAGLEQRMASWQQAATAVSA